MSPRPAGGDGRLSGGGFEIETLIYIRVARSGVAVTEVPSFEHSRMHGDSNLSAFSDGVRVLRTILVERRRSRRLLPSHVARDPANVRRRMADNVMYERSVHEDRISSALEGRSRITMHCRVLGRRSG